MAASDRTARPKAAFVYMVRCTDRCAALRREAALKKLPKAQKELLCTAWQAAGRPFAEHGAGSAG